MIKEIITNQPLEAWISMIENRELQFEKALRDVVSKTKMRVRDRLSYTGRITSLHGQKIPLDLVKQNGEHLLETDSTLVHIGRAVATLRSYEKFMLLVRIVEEDFPPLARRIFIEFLLAELGHECFSCMLAEYGVNLNREMKNKGALLPYVAHLNDKKLLEELLSTNTIPYDSILEHDNLNLLHYAAKGSADKVARFLIEKGLNVSAADNFGRTPLHYAALLDDSKTTGLLINAGAKLDTKDTLGLSPVFYAVFGRSMKTLKLLKKRGANITQSNSRFETPLHIAAINNDVELTLTLKELGGLNFKTERCDIVDHQSLLRARCLERPIVYALYQHSYDVAKILTTYRPMARYVRSTDGSTPLHIVARYKSIEMIDHLVKYGADVNAQDMYGQTPIFLVLQHPEMTLEMRLDALDALLRHNANLSITERNGRTLLHAAVISGKNTAVIEKLIKEGSTVNAVTNDGETPLMLATDLRNSAAIVPLFLNNEDTINFKNPINGKTPLHYAAERNIYLTVRILLQAGAANNVEDDSGNTALESAILNGSDKSIEAFIDLKKNIDTIMKSASVILTIATKNNNVNIIKKLETNGIDIYRERENGVTLLMIAAQYVSNDVARYFLQQEGVVNNSDKEKKWSALHYAARRNNHEIIKYLVDAGADVNLQDGDGWTPLKIASFNCYSEAAIDKLLELKADVELADRNNETPLHAAARSNNVAFVDKLIKIGGASYSALNSNNATPYLVAIVSNANRVVEYLKSNRFHTTPDSISGWKTLLHFAAEGDNVAFVETHLRRVFNFANRKDDARAGKTALHTAAYHGSLKIMRYFVANLVEFDVVDDEGRTALFDAVRNNQHETVKFLIRHGMPVYIRDKYKQTALDFARKEKLPSMVELLKPYYTK